jgi:hypothetical protein
MYGGKHMKGCYYHRQDNFESLTKRTFAKNLIRMLEQEYKLLGSHRILEMLASDIESLIKTYYPLKDRIRAGTICWVTTKRTYRKPSYGTKTEDYETVVVYLPLVNEDDLNKRVFIRNGDRNSYYQRNRERDITTMIRIIKSAWDQGGMLCQAELAVLLNRALTTIRRYLLDYEAQHPDDAIPLKGYILDQGSRPTHKAIIITLFEQGVDPLDIAARTNHSLDSVDRYLKNYNRVKELYRKNISRQEIKKVTGITLKVIDEYLRVALHYHADIKEKWQNSTKK